MTNDNPIERVTKAQIDLVTAAFDNATRYVNIFILAGYGGFFGLWNITRDRLVTGQRAPIIAALLMLVSLTAFVLYQLYAVYLNSSSLVRTAEAFLARPPATPDELVQRIEEHGFIQKAMTPKILRVWRPMFIVTVATGLAAFVVLAWAFVAALMTCTAPVPLACP